jgi:hypothetical protein
MYGDEGPILRNPFGLQLMTSFVRISFNMTLLILGIFSTAAGGSPNYIALSSFAAVWSVGVGGNLPVDSAVFLGMYWYFFMMVTSKLMLAC